MKRLVCLLASALLALSIATGARAQTPAAKPSAQAASAPAATGKADQRGLDVATKAWKGDFDGMLERRSDQVLRALQPLAVLHRQGPRARHLGRPDPRVRALGEQEVRGTARQAPADRGRHRRHARQDAGRSSRRARRRRGRQHQGPPRAAERRRLRRPRREGRRRRDPGDRPGHAGHRLDRRPFGQDRAPARGLEPDAEHEGVERALQAGRQARSQARLPAERARGRGPARDAQCRAAAGGRGRRLEGQDVGPGAAQGEGSRGHRAAAEDEDGLGDPQEQPEARGRADRVLCVLRQAGRRSPGAAAPVHGPRQGAEGRDGHRGPASASWRWSTPSRSTASSTTSIR